MKSAALLAIIGAGAAVALLSVARSPWIVWNASRSVPIGLYRVQAAAPGQNDLVLVRLPPVLAELANRRGYLHGTDYVLKPVAAVAGETVCRFGLVITVRSAVAALAKRRDGDQRPMPVWHGCHVLKLGELFLLSAPPDSFDSRYFGPITEIQVIGRAQALLTVPNTVE